MNELQQTVDKLINLSSTLLDTAVHLNQLLQKPDSWYCFVPQYFHPTMKEIYEQRLAALERYRQQYEQEYGDSEVFESGEDEIDASKFENPNLHTQQKQQQMPIESYYTECRSRPYSRCSDES